MTEWEPKSHPTHTTSLISPVYFSELCKRRVEGPSQLSVSTPSFSGDGFSFLGRQLWLSHIKAFDGKGTGNLKYIWLEGNRACAAGKNYKRRRGEASIKQSGSGGARDACRDGSKGKSVEDCEKIHNYFGVNQRRARTVEIQITAHLP